jgi:hypothetical protein
MTTLTITTKSQIPLKRYLLKHLGAGPGEKIEADKLPDGRIVEPPVSERKGAGSTAFGTLG